jgi:hypothetical protein
MTMMPYIVIGEVGARKQCCKDVNNLDYIEGDGVDWEEWKCNKCGLNYIVPIEIQRYWDDMELVEKRKR